MLNLDKKLNNNLRDDSVSAKQPNVPLYLYPLLKNKNKMIISAFAFC